MNGITRIKQNKFINNKKPSKKRKQSNDDTIQRKNKSSPSSRITLPLKDCVKWSEEEAILLLCLNVENGGVGLERNQSDRCKPFSGDTIHDITSCFALKYSEEDIIKDLVRDRPKADVNHLIRIIHWVAKFKGLLGYANWSSTGIGELLQKETRDGGAGISMVFFKELSNFGFNGKTLDRMVGYLGRDYRHSKVVQLLEDEFKTNFKENVKQLVKNICVWIEKNLLFIINLPLYQPLEYDLNCKGLTKSELRLLGEISNLELEDLSKVTSGADQFTFNIHNRQEAFDVMKLAAEKQFKSSQNQNKKDLTFLIAKGGSGIGKSRIVIEMNNRLRSSNWRDELLNEVFQHSSVIYFNFTNGFFLDGSDRDKEFISMISSRIVSSCFSVPHSFLNCFPPISNDLFLFELFRIISNKLHAQYELNLNVPIPLILALDEYQEAIRKFRKLNNLFPQKIGYYMENIQTIHGLVLIPVLCGTLTKQEADFEQYSTTTIPLPSLRPQDIQSILISENLGKLYNSSTKHFWNLVGIIPRHLEWSVAQVKVYNTSRDVLSTIFDNIIERMYYFYDESVFKELALIVLSGYSLDFVGRNYEKLVSSFRGAGLIYTIKNSIGLPPVIIEKISEKYNLIPSNLLTDTKTDSKLECEVFGEMCLKTFASRLNVFLTIKKKSNFSFSELFKGAHFPTLLQNTKLEINIGIIHYISTSNYFSKKDLGYYVTKVKTCSKGITGFLPILSKSKVFLLQNKCIPQSSMNDNILHPSEIATSLQKANVNIAKKQVYIILFTNKSISSSTKQMIANGQLEINQQKNSKVDCTNLIVISGDCFQYFFHPYITEMLLA